MCYWSAQVPAGLEGFLGEAARGSPRSKLDWRLDQAVLSRGLWREQVRGGSTVQLGGSRKVTHPRDTCCSCTVASWTSSSPTSLGTPVTHSLLETPQPASTWAIPSQPLGLGWGSFITCHLSATHKGGHHHWKDWLTVPGGRPSLSWGQCPQAPSPTLKATVSSQ